MHSLHKGVLLVLAAASAAANLSAQTDLTSPGPLDTNSARTRTSVTLRACWVETLNKYTPMQDQFADSVPFNAPQITGGSVDEMAFTESFAVEMTGYANAFDANGFSDSPSLDPRFDASARSFSFMGQWDLFWNWPCELAGNGKYDGVMSAVGEVMMDETAGLPGGGAAGGMAVGRLSLYTNLTRAPSHHIFIDAAAAESEPDILDEMVDPADPYRGFNTDNPWGIAIGSGLAGPPVTVQGLASMIDTNSLVGPFQNPNGSIDLFFSDNLGVLPLDKLYLMQWATLKPSGSKQHITEAWVQRQTSLEVRAHASWQSGDLGSGLQAEAYIFGFNSSTVVLN